MCGARMFACIVPIALTVFADEVQSVPSRQAGAQIEVCFVLDTTGSMGGLIEGAKAKIWSIANQMIAAKPTPTLRIALVGYRDRGDRYVTKLFDLSEDIDTVYAHLQEFKANGGGDTPESVNQALHEAVSKVTWSQSRDVLKIIFLVGDCPPHMDYQDDVKYPQTCQTAVKKDLIINTVQCGSHRATTPIWQEIARLSEGRYVAIGQSGDMQVITTPMDAELAELNIAIGKTLIPYGDVRTRRGVFAKQSAAEHAVSASVVADRLAYNAASGRVVQGGGDLIDDIKSKRVKLAEVARKDLPPEMQKLTAKERAAYVARQSSQRRQIQARVAKLVTQRQAFIDDELRKLTAAGKGSAFDTQVNLMLREQAAKKGIHYDSNGDSEGSSTKP